MSTLPKQLVEMLEASCVRFEKILWIAAMAVDGSCSSDLSDFLDFPSDLRSAFPDMSESVADDCTEGDTELKCEAFLEFLGPDRSAGFLVNVATPHPDGNSWGYMRTKWIFALSLEDAAAKAIRWADDVAGNERAEVAS